MAVSDFSSAQKPHVYDLLARLNASFARVIRHVALLEQVGIFDPQTISRLHTRSKEREEQMQRWFDFAVARKLVPAPLTMTPG